MPKEHDLSAYRFHHDLFLSGFERIILVRALQRCLAVFSNDVMLDFSQSFNDVLPNAAS
jgi:hypothetical protein